jgi:hypothetical protein
MRTIFFIFPVRNLCQKNSSIYLHAFVKTNIFAHIEFVGIKTIKNKLTQNY